MSKYNIANKINIIFLVYRLKAFDMVEVIA